MKCLDQIEFHSFEITEFPMGNRILLSIDLVSHPSRVSLCLERMSVSIETVKFKIFHLRAGVDGLVVMTWAFQADS